MNEVRSSTVTVSPEVFTLATLEAMMPEAERAELNELIYRVRQAFVYQWARSEAKRGP